MAKIKQVCVIGGGTMGRGIVAAFLNANIPVTLVERNQESSAFQLLDSAAANVKKLVKRTPAQLTLSTKMPGAQNGKNYDLFVEAVFERMSLKTEIFEHLDRIADKTAILATNTSTLNLNQIASTTSRPSRVIGMHFFNPPHKNQLLEVVLGSQTSSEVVQTAVAVGRRIGKVPVVVRNCPGFVANRMCHPYFEGVQRLISYGISPYRIDKVLESCGLVIGPCKTQDLIGFQLILDIGKANLWDFVETGLLPKLVEAGRLGRKNGKGWYSFDGSTKKQSESKEVLNLVKKHAVPPPSEITDAKIIEYTLFPLINEGFKIIDEDIVNSPNDIDTIWLQGYGWPPATGGPIRWAFKAGLSDIVRCMDQHVTETALSLFVVSPLLRRLSQFGAQSSSALEPWVQQNLWNLNGAPVPLPISKL